MTLYSEEHDVPGTFVEEWELDNPAPAPGHDTRCGCAEEACEWELEEVRSYPDTDYVTVVWFAHCCGQQFLDSMHLYEYLRTIAVPCDGERA